MPWVELQAKGSSEEPLAVARLIALAKSRGFGVRVEDQAALETGAGRMEIEPPGIDEQNIARGAVQALIEEVPGGLDTFTIV